MAGDPYPGASGGSTAPSPAPGLGSPASGTVKEHVSAVSHPLFCGHGLWQTQETCSSRERCLRKGTETTGPLSRRGSGPGQDAWSGGLSALVLSPPSEALQDQQSTSPLQL